MTYEKVKSLEIKWWGFTFIVLFLHILTVIILAFTI